MPIGSRPTSRSIIAPDLTAGGGRRGVADRARSGAACSPATTTSSTTRSSASSTPTASLPAFTVVAATRHEDRRTSIFGSRGQITTDGSTVEVYDFATRAADDLRRDRRRQRPRRRRRARCSAAFIDALRLGEPERFSSNGAASLATHRIVFAAERARTTGSVVEL